MFPLNNLIYGILYTVHAAFIIFIISHIFYSDYVSFMVYFSLSEYVLWLLVSESVYGDWSLTGHFLLNNANYIG